jgi:hypothetical protein
MHVIKNLQLITNLLPDWAPTHLAIIKKLSLSYNEEQPANELTIDFLSQSRTRTNSWPQWDQPFQQIRINFINVSGFNLKQAGGSMHQVMGFDIENLSGNGWESVHFYISDYENGSIEFYCSAVEVIACEGLL